MSNDNGPEKAMTEAGAELLDDDGTWQWNCSDDEFFQRFYNIARDHQKSCDADEIERLRRENAELRAAKASEVATNPRCPHCNPSSFKHPGRA